jgi:hypothetical protein
MKILSVLTRPNGCARDLHSGGNSPKLALDLLKSNCYFPDDYFAADTHGQDYDFQLESRSIPFF